MSSSTSSSSPSTSPSSPLKICVIGAGAVGGFFGARLALAGHDVSVVARGATLEAIQSNGWIYEHKGERQAAKVRATNDASTLGVQDVVVIAVKAYALTDIAPMISSLVGPDTIVVPAVNGVPWWFTLGASKVPVKGKLDSVDPTGQIEAAIDARNIIGAVVYPSCMSPAPGVTRHNSGTKVVFGEPDAAPNAPPSARLQRWVDALNGAGFEAEASPDIRVEVWKKLLGNVCFNPVSLITGSATDVMIDDAGVYKLFSIMMQETLDVGTALGIDVGIKVADRIAVSRKLGNIKTSMLQDAEAGRSVEVDAILRATCELGQKVGVSTPALDTVYALAHMRAKTFGLMKA